MITTHHKSESAVSLVKNKNKNKHRPSTRPASSLTTPSPGQRKSGTDSDNPSPFFNAQVVNSAVRCITKYVTTRTMQLNKHRTVLYGELYRFKLLAGHGWHVLWPLAGTAQRDTAIRKGAPWHFVGELFRIWNLKPSVETFC